jgi:hypothetical protein
MRRNKIHGQFAWRLIEMLEAPAYCVLSHSAHRILARIEIELGHHGGYENGNLPVTFDDFERYGVRRHAIAPAIRELEALKFIEITERGRAGNAEFRQPHKYRLTYRHTGRANPTDEWKQIKTIEEAIAIVMSVRGKTKTQWQKLPVVGDKKRTKKHRFHSAKTDTTRIVRKPSLLSISPPGISERAPHAMPAQRCAITAGRPTRRRSRILTTTVAGSTTHVLIDGETSKMGECND